MKKFSFSLRSVQTVRSIHEMRAREVFSLALKQFSDAQRQLDGVRDGMRRLDELIMAKRGMLVNAAEQVSFINEQGNLRKMEVTALDTLKQTQTKLDSCREAWIKARRDLKVIDNLENKARQEYRLELEREIQALLDDRTNATFGRAPLLMS